MNFIFVLVHFSGNANATADYLSPIYVNPYAKLELRINSKNPTRDASLRMVMQVPDNSIKDMLHDCEVPRTKHDFASQLSSLNAEHVPNPLDSHNVTGCLNPIQQIEQQKDPKIMQVIEWIGKGLPPPLPYLNRPNILNILNVWNMTEEYYIGNFLTTQDTRLQDNMWSQPTIDKTPSTGTQQQICRTIRYCLKQRKCLDNVSTSRILLNTLRIT